ncbi:Hypothetical protein CINCED_3A021366 [Cinara cedri]|uniref:Uncharacterized protein n=1 Tax=Cinara cedri TaxID=506608 RepID=A0A5E4M985_9HEMI|nr:Hypothetical protein CINCED_3A021366 [Cinara cedri]
MSIESFCKDLGRDCEVFSKGLLYGFQYGATEAKKLEYNNDASYEANHGLEGLPKLTDNAIYPATDPTVYIPNEDPHLI